MSSKPHVEFVLTNMDGYPSSKATVLVDAEDAALYRVSRFYVARRNGNLVALLRNRGQALHEKILDVPDGITVRAINGNYLDCRKANYEKVARS